MQAVLVLGLLGMALVRLTDEPITIRIAPSVSVSAERFHLGAIAEIIGGDAETRQRLGAIELGASPLPGQKRRFTRQQVMTRLRQHGFQPSTLRFDMPDSIEITRTAQSLETNALEAFARAEIQKRTGVDLTDWRLENPPSNPALPQGEVSLTVGGTPRVSATTALIEVVVSVGGQERGRYALRFSAPARQRTLVVRAGETVRVEAKVEGVVVEVSGVARASGAEGEVIPVYISATQKTVRAHILEKGRVEVLL